MSAARTALRRAACTLLLSMLLGACGSLPFAGREGTTFTFEDQPVGAVPASFEIRETHGAGSPAAWRVEDDDTRKDSRRVLKLAETHNPAQVFNVLLSTHEHGPDLKLSVRIRADGGAIDAGGGLLWRARDENNYYVARWNPLEDNLRLYRVVGGERTLLRGATIKTDPRAWHTLAVEAKGNHIIVAMDGEGVLAADDATFEGSGRIGLWTKADAASSFDDLHVEG